MDNDELESIGLLGFDEKTETWFIDTRESRRLLLDRQTIEGIVRVYNSIHSGNPLTLYDRRSVRRLEDDNRRLAHTIRDLYDHIDRERAREPRQIAQRIVGAIRGRLDPRLRKPHRSRHPQR
jgi:hypothetical protein